MEKIGKKLISINPEKYGILFDLFRRSSNEEKILVDKILTSFGYKKYNSLLDIGAGDGSITQKLMPYFDDITAIDRLDSNIYFLRSLGIEAEKCLWEIYQTNKLYDIILASHIIYHFPTKNWTKEIMRMEEILNSNGKMFIIINSQDGEFADFSKYFYPKIHKKQLELISSNEIISNLRKQGTNVTNTPLESEVIFENKTHFLSLCKFLLDYDFDENEPIKNELDKYFSSLNLVGKDRCRRKMVIQQDFITINK